MSFVIRFIEKVSKELQYRKYYWNVQANHTRSVGLEASIKYTVQYDLSYKTGFPCIQYKTTVRLCMIMDIVFDLRLSLTAISYLSITAADAILNSSCVPHK